MTRVGKRMFGEAFGFAGIDVAGRLDGDLFRELAARIGVDEPEAQHPQFLREYLTELEAELEQCAGSIRIMPGVKPALAEIDADTRAVQGMVTGNYRGAAELKLAAAGFDVALFGPSAFGDEAHSRSELVRLAVERYHRSHDDGLASRDVVVIGDTPRDVRCARDNGCVAFAVATGHHSIDELRAAGADVVVDDLSDPTPLTELID
jgi:phosphoglycolate phosphatase-like HAD superfamily hydrolase